MKKEILLLVEKLIAACGITLLILALFTGNIFVKDSRDQIIIEVITGGLCCSGMFLLILTVCYHLFVRGDLFAILSQREKTDVE